MSDTSTEQLVSHLSLTSDLDGTLIDENVLAGAYMRSTVIRQHDLPSPNTIGSPMCARPAYV